jgi:hypothetical protein
MHQAKSLELRLPLNTALTCTVDFTYFCGSCARHSHSSCDQADRSHPQWPDAISRLTHLNKRELIGANAVAGELQPFDQDVGLPAKIDFLRRPGAYLTAEGG